LIIKNIIILKTEKKERLIASMRYLKFNFNNEVDIFKIIENDNKTITVPGPDGNPIAEYDNLKQFCEMYALARDVYPDDLQNWAVVEIGDVISFVLRVGTAGAAFWNRI